MMAAIGCALSSPASAQVQDQFQVLHAFVYGSLNDGAGPTGLQVFDKEGNLYGTTGGGGAYMYGTAYELTRGGANGQWTETILHNFPDGATDGYQPTGVVIDGAGNLYGATTHGGLNGLGTVFELTPGANGQWTETILWNFCSLPDCADGGGPLTPTLNPAGGLYGVTYGYPGTAFELTPGVNGWTFSLLYTFCSQPNCADGSNPIGPLTLDAKGNLYGETFEGGTTDGGTVFTLQPQSGGQWKESVLHDFDVEDPAEGYDPSGGATLHQNGLYATTQGGGGSGCDGGCGTVFELTQGSGGAINEQVLHDFSANGSQGNLVDGVVVFDDRGDLFGVAGEGVLRLADVALCLA